MEQYIKKSAIVVEIERRKNLCEKIVLDLRTQENKDYYQGKSDAYKEIISFLDTLEMKESLTWQDIRLILEIGDDFISSEESNSFNEKDYYKEILNRFKAQKGK